MVTDPSQLSGEFDMVLVGVKAHQTIGAAGWLEAACGPGVVVAAMQNGVEAVERLTPLVGEATVLDGVVYCGGTLVAPGHTINSGGGRLILPDRPAAALVVDVFRDTPARVTADPDHVTAQWRKLGVNVALNGVTALTDQPIPVASTGPFVLTNTERSMTMRVNVGRSAPKPWNRSSNAGITKTSRIVVTTKATTRTAAG